MKKRIVIILVTGLVIASLAGCGTQADATNQSPESSSAVESQPEPTESETGSDAESKTESTESSETTSEEVVGDNAETSESGDLEDDNIILYAEKAECYENLEQYEYSAYDGVINAKSVIGLYDGEGYRVGEMKIDGTVYVGEIDRVHNWARFKNPIEGTEYEFLYTTASYVENNNRLKLTTEEAENLIKELIGHPEVYTFTEKTDDMEVCEFMIHMYYDEMQTPEEELFFILRDSCDEVWPHHTLAVVCTEDTDDYILCQLYYKD